MAPTWSIIHLPTIILPPPHSLRMGPGLHARLRRNHAPHLPLHCRTLHWIITVCLHNRILHHRPSIRSERSCRLSGWSAGLPWPKARCRPGLVYTARGEGAIGIWILLRRKTSCHKSMESPALWQCPYIGVQPGLLSSLSPSLRGAVPPSATPHP